MMLELDVRITLWVLAVAIFLQAVLLAVTPLARSEVRRRTQALIDRTRHGDQSRPP